MIQDTYTPYTWTQVYTEGSASAAIKDGGADIFILHTSGRSETNIIPTGRHCTNYRAKVEAIIQAIKLIEESPESSPNAVIFTDALSVLQALENSKQTSISRELFSQCKTRVASLQWIPAHRGVPGNENADRLAKLGATDNKPQNAITHEEKATMIKALTKPRLTKDDYHLLDRWEQVITFRLHTGHNRLNAQMCTKLKMSPSTMCPCGLEQQTAEHNLQRCPRLEN
ncbi:ribonuclease H-like [Mercenaria mercenaria]|uniref:ribonuclease H-like n=1 Tax=Mercenaria mercenaria TaxID=6596 RepID=UPI00234ED5E5|nr:ribonuclease H-like [Mercenaria mercenaria]